ncbi:MAG: hypothetical protein ACKVUS_07460 [Saprospiraceae bacterium]
MGWAATFGRHFLLRHSKGRMFLGEGISWAQTEQWRGSPSAATVKILRAKAFRYKLGRVCFGGFLSLKKIFAPSLA